jgi:hypothetical protein
MTDQQAQSPEKRRMGGKCDSGYALSKFEHSEDGSARVGNVRQRIPEESEVLEHNEYCIPRLSKLTEPSHGCVLTDTES